MAFSIPTSNVSSYLTLFPYQLLSGFFKKSQHFSKCVHGSNCGFNLNFLVINDVDYVFIVATHVSSLITCLFRYFTPFFFFYLPGGLWNLSSPTKDWIWATAVRGWNPSHEATKTLFYPVFNWIVFLLLTFESSLYILDRRSFLAMYFANISSQSTCLFIFLVNFCILTIFLFFALSF